MISNNPLFMRDQDHQAMHSDILAAARSATVTSPPTSWRTGDFDNLGGVAFKRPASISVAEGLEGKDIYNLARKLAEMLLEQIES
jgi:hypothetical protein